MICLENPESFLKISIIVPVYNTAKFLPRCLDSLIDQKIQKEIIIVNDGSTDDSRSILSLYQANNSEIIIIDKENGGLSSARNEGLKVARGEFIGFVDSDDWIKENALELLWSKASKDNLDILAFDPVLYFDEDNVQSISRDLKLAGKVLSGEEFFNYSIRYRSLQVPVCFHLFRREVLESNHLRFVEGIFHEDWQFTPRVYFKAKRIEYINQNLYYYRKGVSSITAKTTKKHIRDLLFVADELLLLEESGNHQSKRYLRELVLGIYFSLLRLSCHDPELSEFVKRLFKEKKLQNFAISNFSESISFRTKIQILLLTVSINLYMLIVSTVRR
jgi:glycosyltransferase involved in cell wall biosynthesis